MLTLAGQRQVYADSGYIDTATIGDIILIGKVSSNLWSILTVSFLCLKKKKKNYCSVCPIQLYTYNNLETISIKFAITM